MDERQIRETVNQLVESQLEGGEARKCLARFRESNDPPGAPREFENLQAVLDFYGHKQDYEDQIRNLQTELDAAIKAYRQAESTLRSILPGNVPLYYSYEGERQELEGVRYRIMNRVFNRQSQLSISSAGPEAAR